MFNLVATHHEVRPALDVVGVGVPASAQQRLVRTHQHEGVFLKRRDADDVEHVGAVPRVHLSMHDRLEIAVQLPEVVLACHEVFAADLSQRVDRLLDAFDDTDLFELEHAVNGNGSVSSIVLKGDPQLLVVGFVGKVRILHIALTEEADAVPHTVPTRIRPNNVLRIEGETDRIALPPVGRQTGRPQRLEGVGSQNESHDAEGDLVKARQRTEGFALHFGDECIKARCQEHSQTEEHHHAPEHDFGPHLSVNAEDVKTEALTHVAHGVIAQVAERHVKAEGSHHKQHAQVLGLEAVANHHQRNDTDIGHLLTLRPAQRAGRVTEQITQNQVGDADGQQNDEKTSPADDVVERLGTVEIVGIDRSGVISHFLHPPRLQIKYAKNAGRNMTDVHESDDRPAGNRQPPRPFFLLGLEDDEQHRNGEHQQFNEFH